MEDLVDIVEKCNEYCIELQLLSQEYMEKAHVELWGTQISLPTTTTGNVTTQLSIVTPQQTKKRIKRLSSLNENDEILIPLSAKVPSKSMRTSNTELLTTANAMEEDNESVLSAPVAAPRQIIEQPTEECNATETMATMPTESDLMPPPPKPATLTINPVEHSDANVSEVSFARPKRAAKLKSEKNLKEPKLNQKLRRPSNFDKSKIKLEHEQRSSQMHNDIVTSTISAECDSSKSSLASVTSEASVIAVPSKPPTVVDLNSEEETSADNKANDSGNEKVRKLMVKVKREKLSVGSYTSQVSQEAQQSKTTVETIPGSASEDTDNAFKSVPMPKASVKNEPISDESTIASSSLSATITSSVAATGKRGKKKKIGVHKPIKVERFSDIGKPVCTRARIGGTRVSGGSVYEDAVDRLPSVEASSTPPTRVSIVPPQVAAAAGINETVTVQSGDRPNATVLAGVASSDATFCTNMAQTTFQVDVGQATFIMDNQNANATVTLDKKCIAMGDATFNITPKNGNDVQNSLASSQNSMQTAKDSSHPQQDSLLTEDESMEPEKQDIKLASKLENIKTSGKLAKLPTSAKAYKMPTRTNELFNPLIQSPVKKKVEAFENAAIAAISTELTKAGRPKRTKENAVPPSTTPLIGKLTAPLGRFLTPTQATNLTPNVLANVKKAPNSTSKVMAFPKAITTIKSGSSSTTNKGLSRENSAEDFRKGLHNLAEERKKQREQKHQLAAQQREAKERERADRIAKLNKEREEKRLKKLQEAEQKKRALEEIQRNLRQQEEAAAAAEAAKLKAAKTKAIVEQERELLQQMKQQTTRAAKMLPPPPKLQSKYTFEMLHEDDSTDEEDKTTYKRPPPPAWSRSNVRGTAIRVQQYWPTKIIDSFFSVQPMSPDLRLIFPNIGKHHLKRNSSAMWSTPPRYSELPKY